MRNETISTAVLLSCNCLAPLLRSSSLSKVIIQRLSQQKQYMLIVQYFKVAFITVLSSIRILSREN